MASLELPATVASDGTATFSLIQGPSLGSFWAASFQVPGAPAASLFTLTCGGRTRAQFQGGSTFGPLELAAGDNPIRLTATGLTAGAQMTAVVHYTVSSSPPGALPAASAQAVDVSGSTVDVSGSSISIDGPITNNSSWQAPSQAVVLNYQGGVVDGSYGTSTIPTWTKALVVVWNVPAGASGASSAFVEVSPSGGGISWPALPGSTWMGQYKVYAVFPWVAVAGAAVLNVSSITSAGGSPGFTVLALDYVPTVPRTLQVAQIGVAAGKTATLIGMGDGSAIELHSITVTAWQDTSGAVEASVYWGTTSSMIAQLDCYDTGAFSARYQLGDARGGAIYTGPDVITLAMGGTDGAAHATATYELIN